MAVRRAHQVTDGNGAKERGRREKESVKVGLAGKSVGFPGDGLHSVPGGGTNVDDGSSLDLQADPGMIRTGETTETDQEPATAAAILRWSVGGAVVSPASAGRRLYLGKALFPNCDILTRRRHNEPKMKTPW